MDDRKNKDRSNIKITYAELMQAVEEYQPTWGKRRFTPEQDKFLKAAKKKNMSVREMKIFWDKLWDNIGRDIIARRLKELE